MSGTSIASDIVLHKISILHTGTIRRHHIHIFRRKLRIGFGIVYHYTYTVTHGSDRGRGYYFAEIISIAIIQSRTVFRVIRPPIRIAPIVNGITNGIQPLCCRHSVIYIINSYYDELTRNIIKFVLQTRKHIAYSHTR